MTPDREVAEAPVSRRPVLVAAAVAVVVAAAGWLLEARVPVAVFQAWGDSWVYQTLRSVVMPLGKSDLQIVVAVLVGALGLRRRASAALVALLVTGLLVAVLKPAVGRPRPTGPDELTSFPSGDTASAAAVATALVAPVPGLWPVAALAVGGVAVCRVVDGRHYPSDVAAGAGIGLLIGVWFAGAARRWRRIPSSRWFAGAGVVGLVLIGTEAGLDWSQRHLTALAVLLPPLLLAVTARWSRLAVRRRRDWTQLLRVAPLAAAGVSLALCWVLAAGSSLWDRDEPRFARAAVEMLDSGDWLVPTFNGALRPDKPVGIYWLMASSRWLFGRGEWPVRLWAGLGVALAALLVGRFGARRLGPREGAVAALVVGLSPLAVVAGSAATTDGVLLAAVTGATLLVAGGLLERFTIGRTVALGLVLGAGQLIKGPVALVVPLLAGVGWILLAARRGDRRWRGQALALAAATAIGLGVFLAWALPANAATGGEFARQGLGHHVLERASRPLESHGGSFLAYLPFYLVALLLGMLPWSLWIPGTVAAVWRQRLGEPAVRRLLALWVVPMTVVLTLVSTKLPHYILPVVPGLALVLGLGLAASHDRPELAGGRWWAVGRWLLAVTGFGLATGLLAGMWWLPLLQTRRFLAGLAALVVTATWLALRHDRRGERATAVVVLALATVLGFLQLRAMLIEVDALKPAPVIAAAVREVITPSTPVAATGFCEPSLAFYLDHGFTELPRDAASSWLQQHPDGVLIADEAGAAAAAASQPLTTIARATGYNFAKGRRVEVVALRRR